MADPKKMTVEEMLAAARAEKAASGGAVPAAKTPPAPKKTPPAEEPSSGEAESAAAPAEASTPKKPAAKPAAGKPGAMSVADMLAAARGEKSGAPAAAAAPKAEPKAEPKKAEPKAKPAAAKAETSAPAKAGAPTAQDTTSVLAERKADKLGPMTKAEAAAKGQEPVKVEKKKAEAPPMPAKPAYARPAPAAADEQDRRGFMGTMMAALVGTPLAIGFSSLAVTHLLWVLGFARFMFPNILTEPPTRFRVGFPDEYAPGQVQEKYKAQFGVWIVRHEYEGQAEIYALKSVCTHLGCTPNWLEGEQKFKCPCHGSGFYKDGINFEGPAPRPSERYAVRKADDGQIEVDKSRTFFEEKGEWKDPASFVPV